MTDREREDLELKKLRVELENQDKKSDQQRRMAWVAMIAVLIVTAIFMSPLMPDSRVSLLGDVLSMFYVTQAGIIAAFFGATAWMSKK